ncbi:MAG: Autoinducer 2 import system permease protein LsrD [Acidimicrobiaceae bacterium]|nr:ABC transporter permease [Acidimicrobiaceae bacterium]CAI8364251.1 MAG: Autoinducer 2 import system permease protein LsrD [Acidimicrobiaceae bacterium]|tara:strand:+ start:735 stop:1667 length:933 start_codon:yes stop_codon:yes gene_type:complete
MGFFEAIWDVLSTETAYTAATRFAAVLVFAAVGEWVAERSGTLNISIEAMILTGAFAGAMGYDLTESALVGILMGMVAGLLVSLVQAQMSHRLTADQFVVGLTLNILFLGVTSFLYAEWKPSSKVVSKLEIPVLKEIPLIGKAFFGQPWPFLLLYLLVPFTWWLVYRTRWGLEVRAVGENPQAADVSGIDVNKRRRQSIYYAGLCSGMGGAYLLLGQVGRFDDGIVAGRGFIALVAVIFGGWTLRGTILGCLLFGSVLSFRLTLPGLGYQLNSELMSSLPFLVTIIAMTAFARRVRPPGSLARPFVRGLK